MSIRNFQNTNIRIIELGLGTTGISQVHVNDDKLSSGIAFSDTIDGTLSNNAVIIQIINEKGVYSYLRAIFGLLETWQTNDAIKEQLNILQKELTKQMNFEKK